MINPDTPDDDVTHLAAAAASFDDDDTLAEELSPELTPRAGARAAHRAFIAGMECKMSLEDAELSPRLSPERTTILILVSVLSLPSLSVHRIG